MSSSSSSRRWSNYICKRLNWMQSTWNGTFVPEQTIANHSYPSSDFRSFDTTMAALSSSLMLLFSSRAPDDVVVVVVADAAMTSYPKCQHPCLRHCVFKTLSFWRFTSLRHQRCKASENSIVVPRGKRCTSRSAFLGSKLVNSNQIYSAKSTATSIIKLLASTEKSTYLHQDSNLTRKRSSVELKSRQPYSLDFKVATANK